MKRNVLFFIAMMACFAAVAFENFEIALNSGKNNMDKGDNEAALKDYRSALKLASSEANKLKADIEIASCLFFLSKSTDADKIFTRISKDKNATPEQISRALCFRGRILKDAGKIQKAIEMFEKSAFDFETSSPNTAGKALYYAGECYREQKEFEKALDSYKKSSELPSVAENIKIESKLCMGHTLQEMGSRDKAIELYDTIFREAQDLQYKHDALRSVGDCFNAQGLTDMACSKYQYVIDNEKDCNFFKDYACLRLGDIYRKMGRASFARDSYAKVPQIKGAMKPRVVEAIIGIGNTFMDERKYDDARKRYSEVVADKDVSPEDRDNAQRLIASSYQIEKKYDDAVKAYYVVLKSKSKKGMAIQQSQKGIAECLKAAGKNDEVVKFCKEALKNSNMDDYIKAEIALQLAGSYRDLNQDDEAVKMAGAVLKLKGLDNSQMASALYLRGTLLFKKDDFANARKDLQELLKIDNLPESCKASAEEMMK